MHALGWRVFILERVRRTEARNTKEEVHLGVRRLRQSSYACSLQAEHGEAGEEASGTSEECRQRRARAQRGSAVVVVFALGTARSLGGPRCAGRKRGGSRACKRYQYSSCQIRHRYVPETTGGLVSLSLVST